jgi:ribokinase
MSRRKIIVIGSCNTDMVIKTSRFPTVGETVVGGTFFMNPGGKGANQAIAARRLGGDVAFICKTGNDIFGRQSEEHFLAEGIDTSYLISDPLKPSGVALITIDENADNCIVVAPGANAALSPDDLLNAKSLIENAFSVLIQLEIPIETAYYAIELARENNVQVILNPAPATQLCKDILQKVSIITPNQTEAEMISGIKVNDIESARKAAKIIHELGVATVVITLGSLGALLLHEDCFYEIKSKEVVAVDTTAAGDVFNGALAVALSESKNIEKAVEFACAAAALSVTRMGAQTSIPHRNEMLQAKLL